MSMDLSRQILDANKRSFAAQAAKYDQYEVCFSPRARKGLLKDIQYIVDNVSPTNCQTNQAFQADIDSRPTILDCGAGTGNIGLEFLKSGFKVVGVDLSAEMLDIFYQKALKLDQQSNLLELINQDIDSFLLSNRNCFDVVVCSSFLHHLPKYLPVVNELCDRVNPGGFLYIAWEPLPKSNRTILQKLFVKTDNFVNLILHDPLSIISIPLNMIRGIGRVNERATKKIELVDYHIPTGLNVGEIIKCIEEGKLEIVALKNFAGRRVNIFQSLAEHYHFHDHFSVIAKRTKEIQV